MAKRAAYPRFDAGAICQKCGCDNIRATYLPARECAPDCMDRNHSYPEYIARQCLRCGYQWREAPLDARREEDADARR